MALLFPFKPLKTKHPVVTLNGRSARPKPIVTVTLIGPTGTVVRDALLDSAADDAVFPEEVARRVGLNLTHAPEGEAAGVGGVPVRLRYAEVTLRLATNTERREWRAWVGFTSARLKRPLLGFAGCLQFFDALFFGQHEQVELTVNGLYPGT
ncbi:MAG: hypothetical protein L0212_07260 [Acidobacteria bacterium]|nr:hypothetical protein [Acidobacteriota bacterium]